MTHDMEWYYNLVTGQVEHYEGGKATDRLGPYATRQEAEHALALAQERNEEWDNDPRYAEDEDGDDADGDDYGTSGFDTFRP